MSAAVPAGARCLLCAEQAVDALHRIERLPLYLHAVAPERLADVPWLPFHAGVCGACGHVQQLEIPDPALVAPVYTRLFETYQSTVKTGIGSLRAGRFLEFLVPHLPDRGAALEVGCFDGHFLSLLRERGLAVAGCDPSAGAEIARRDLGIDVRREFFRAGLFPAGAQELFVARQVLEHIERPLDFLAAAREVLAPRGLLALELPDARLWLSQGVLGSLFHEHVSYYTAEVLRDLVEVAGFDVLALEHRHTDLFLVAQRSPRPAVRVRRAEAARVHAARELLHGYAAAIQRMRAAVAELVAATHAAGGRVMLCGAGVHSSSLVAACGLTRAHVDRVADDNPAVHGKVLPNLEREIAAPAVALGDAGPADAAIVSGYSFQEELLARLARLGTAARVFRLYPEVQQIAVSGAAARPAAAVC